VHITLSIVCLLDRSTANFVRSLLASVLACRTATLVKDTSALTAFAWRQRLSCDARERWCSHELELNQTRGTSKTGPTADASASAQQTAMRSGQDELLTSFSNQVLGELVRVRAFHQPCERQPMAATPSVNSAAQRMLRTSVCTCMSDAALPNILKYDGWALDQNFGQPRAQHAPGSCSLPFARRCLTVPQGSLAAFPSARAVC